MLKRLLFVSIGLSMVVAACGKSSTGTSAKNGTPLPSGSTAGFQTYTDATYGFNIGYPSEWERQQGAAGSAVAFLSPVEGTSDDFRENVNVLIQTLPDGSFTLEKYTQLSLQQAPSLITGFHLLDQGSTSLSGSPADRVHYQGEQGNFLLEWEQVWTVKDGKAFILTYTAKRDRYQAQLGTAESMFTTFRLP